MLCCTSAYAESSTYWLRMAHRTNSEFAKELYLNESARIDTSRKGRTKKAKIKAKQRVKRIETKNNAQNQPMYYPFIFSYGRQYYYPNRYRYSHHYYDYGY